MSIRIASIDVGLRNLSMAVFQMQLPNPATTRLKGDPAAETKPCDGYSAPWQNLEVIHWELINVLRDNGEDEEQNCNAIPLARWIPMVQHSLRLRLPVIGENVDAVIIENQPNFGAIRIRMIAVLIYSFFEQQFWGHPRPPIVAFVSATMKLQTHIDRKNFYSILKKPRKFETELQGGEDRKARNLIDLFGVSDRKKDVRKRGAKDYKGRKDMAVRLAGSVLHLVKIENRFIEMFQACKKKDDLADSLLQGISFLQRTPPLRK